MQWVFCCSVIYYIIYGPDDDLLLRSKHVAFYIIKLVVLDVKVFLVIFKYLITTPQRASHFLSYYSEISTEYCGLPCNWVERNEECTVNFDGNYSG